MKKFSWILGAFFLSNLLIYSNPAHAESVKFITSKSTPIPIYGKATIGNKSSLRIVALANGSAEIIYSLGLKRHLVGRDIASTFEGDNKIPVVTLAHSISAEKVLAVKPTLVLINSSAGPLIALKQIKSAGVKIITIPEAYSIDGMRAKYQAIINALQISEKDPVVQKLIGAIPTTTSELNGDEPRVVFLYLRGTSGIYLLGGSGSGADSIISISGGKDVGATINSKPFTPLTPEALTELNPGIILVMQKGLDSIGGLKGILKIPGISQTQAGINKKIISVDDSLLLAFGPRTQLLITQLSKIIEMIK